MATQAKKRKTHKSPQRAQETQEETSETNNGTITLSRKEKKRLKKANKLSKKGNGATNSVHVQRDWSDEEDDNEEDVNSPNNTPPEATNKTPNNEETEQPPDDDANSTPETVNTSTLTDNADTTHEPTNNNNNNNNNETALEPATLFSATLLEKILKPMFEQARQQQKGSTPVIFCLGPDVSVVSLRMFIKNKTMTSHNNHKTRLAMGDKTEEKLLRAEWERHTATSMGLMAICNVCGGTSISFCECAYARWKATRKGLAGGAPSHIQQWTCAKCRGQSAASLASAGGLPCSSCDGLVGDGCMPRTKPPKQIEHGGTAWLHFKNLPWFQKEIRDRIMSYSINFHRQLWAVNTASLIQYTGFSLIQLHLSVTFIMHHVNQNRHGDKCNELLLTEDSLWSQSRCAMVTVTVWLQRTAYSSESEG
eukprot:g8768.t1